MSTEYLPRIADRKLELQLAASGAVLIVGPKWCGKTRTAAEKANSILYMQDPDSLTENRMLADTLPSKLLEGDTPRLLDEWQDAPVLWNAVRFTVDQRRKRGQFILTGSVVPPLAGNMHTGTGRISRMTMRTMSLYESNESTGEITLTDLFDEKTELNGKSRLSVEQLAFILTRGGWPEAVIDNNQKASLQTAYNYLDSIAGQNISGIDGVERNPNRVYSLLRSISRNISTQATTTTLLKDLTANDESISQKTVDEYIITLKKLYVVEDLPAWSAKLRSRVMLRTTSKRHFTDPSIAVASLSATPERLLSDFKTFGLLFESLCIRDLRIYAESINGSVFHYRDKNNLEVDAIVQLPDGRWGAVEIKMGAGMIDAAAETLLKLSRSIDTEIMMNPSFLMILTATEYAFQMKNGVWVVPLGCLKD